MQGEGERPVLLNFPSGSGMGSRTTHLSIQQRVAEWEELGAGQWWWEEVSGKGYRCSL